MRRLLAPFVATLLASCGPAGAEVQCNIGSDCASGICQSDGMCAPSTGTGGSAGASSDDAGDGSDAQSSTGGSGGDAGDSPDGSGGGSACVPNHDDMIAREEIPLRAGLHATFKAALNVAVDTTGTVDTSGVRLWDLSIPLAGDHLTLLETQVLDDKWFAPSFPGATYAALLSESENLLGVFEVTEDALLLRGVVSPTAGVTRTELVYDPPARVLSFPLQQGESWQTDSAVTGLALGITSFYHEQYDNQVDARGTLKTPFGDFDTLRVRVVLQRKVGVMTTTVRSFAFVTECFGTVATVASADNETQVEFKQAREVRRLAP